jgi:lysophospholipase L1-like esterase
VVVLGDSLSDARVGGGGYLLAISRACANARVENLAKGGWMVNQIRRRFEAEVLPRLPADFDELIVFGGVNDLYSDETAGRNFQKISSDLASIYRGAKSKGVRVIALTVTPWGGFSRYYNARRAEVTRTLNAWLREQAQLGLVDVVVDANPLLSCGDPERLCPEYALPFRDGLHFGKLGHQKLGLELLRQAFADCAAE